MNKKPLEQERKISKVNSRKVRWNVFLILEIMIFVIIFLGDILDVGIINIDVIKYCGIILCFIYICMSSNFVYTLKEKNVAKVAFFFTILADYFLLFTKYYEIGVVCFLMVQSVYLFRMTDTIKVFIQIVVKDICLWLSLVVVIYLWIGNNRLQSISQFLILICTLYASIFLGNVKQAWKQKDKNIVFFIGLLLFLICDLNVAIYNLKFEMIVGISDIAGKLIWLFYLPSQVLIVKSFLIKEKELV